MLSKHARFFDIKNTSENNTLTPFLMGAGGAAYQIEGAYNEDGKGESNWDRFLRNRKNKNGELMDNGDIACDEYHRFDDTLDALIALGVNSYRFSIAWTRIQPTGEGEPNEKGLQYYRTIIEKLKAAKIVPIVTIYHWDLPQALEEKDGWVNRDTVDKYEAYARILFKEFGSDVGYWITHNEPRVVSTRGYGSPDMAPGLNNTDLIPIVNHHLLLSHGRAVNAFRELQCSGQIGITLNLKPIYNSDDSRKQDAYIANRDKNHQYLSPVIDGKYLDLENTSFIEDGDMDIIKTPIDFLGINNYSIEVISEPSLESLPVNSLGWKVHPKGLYDLLIELKNTYKNLPPIFITENGYADKCTNSSLEAYLQDDARIEYIRNYLEALLGAIEEGVDVIGYCYWALLDNLEWAFGFEQRFGLIHVNFDSEGRERTYKASFTALMELIPVFINTVQQIKEKQALLKEAQSQEQSTSLTI